MNVNAEDIQVKVRRSKATQHCQNWIKASLTIEYIMAMIINKATLAILATVNCHA